MQWRLRTEMTEYAVSALLDGSGLVLDHWGGHVAGEIEPWTEPDRMSGFVTPHDYEPLEYASAGQRHVTFSELLIDRGEALTGASWTLQRSDVEFVSDDDGDRLDVGFLDETGALRLGLHISTSRGHDVIRRRVSLRNSSERTIELPRIFSAGWNVPVGQRARIDYLAGNWSHEFMRRHIDLDWGTFSIGSRQGVTGLLFSPVVTLSALPQEDSFVRAPGQAFGVALDWSGSWRLQADSTQVGQCVRVSCGIDDDTTTVTLLPGEEFTTPDSLGVFSPEGTEGVTRAWQRFQRDELARDLSPRTRPIVYNSWMATTFDVRSEHQLALAGVAKDVGVEVFVVDDGWFVGRTSDASGLGDWVPDPAKLPDGLAALADGIIGLGLRFGLWIEPECVNPDSALYRAHPDWVYQAGERPLVTVRNQYVLDLGREDVVSWMMLTLRELLRSAPISYLKWDMNRAVSDGGRPGDPHGREWSVQHTRNYYRVLKMLREEFPDLTVEACSSGGGRIDNAVLGLSDVVWTSDEVGARDRLVIQDGFLTAYPPHVMSSWVSDDLGHRDRFPTSLGYRFAVSMAGVLGIGSDVLAWGEDERATARRAIALYRDIRPVVHRGVVATHGSPIGDLYAVEYAGPEDDPRIVVFVYDRDRDRRRDREFPRVFPTQLTPGRRYRIEGSTRTVTRESVLATGIPVPFTFDAEADILVLTPIG